MGMSMNVMMEPLHQTNKALPRGLHVRTSYGMYNCGSQRITIQMVATNELPEMVVADGAVGALQTRRWAKGGCVKLTVEERRKILFKRLELSGLKSWMEENKERTLDLLAKYHDIFALKDGEMGCTEAAEHKIEMTDSKPFKERLRNIPSGLLEEVKDHLDHMLDVGVIKPSKLA